MKPSEPRHERSVLPRRVRQWILGVLPRRYQIPARYYYRRLFGTSDPEMKLLKSLVRPGSVTIDVGANLGVYTYALWKLCRRVEAFDPLPVYADLIRAFGAATIGVHPVALSSRPGVQALHFTEAAGQIDLGQATLSPTNGEPGLIQVPVRTLDQFDFRDVSFIKIDVEGHELEVLKGGSALLERERPNLLVEIEQRHLLQPIGVVFEYLQSRGYDGFFLQQRRLRPISEFSVERHQDVSRVYTEDYINNFVFVTDQRLLSFR